MAEQSSGKKRGSHPSPELASHTFRLHPAEEGFWEKGEGKKRGPDGTGVSYKPATVAPGIRAKDALELASGLRACRG